MVQEIGRGRQRHRHVAPGLGLPAGTEPAGAQHEAGAAVATECGGYRESAFGCWAR